MGRGHVIAGTDRWLLGIFWGSLTSPSKNQSFSFPTCKMGLEQASRPLRPPVWTCAANVTHLHVQGCVCLVTGPGHAEASQHLGRLCAKEPPH